MKKYKAESIGNKIVEVDVVRETNMQIVYIDTRNGREVRENKSGNWWCYFDTKELALSYLLGRINEKVANYNRQIQYCKDEYDKVEQRYSAR
jgi:hypothetical protein